MPLYEIWSEGWSATGGSGGAVLHGQAEGETFKEACDNYAKAHPDFAKYYDFLINLNTLEKIPSYWGCRLFDNEGDARKAFG